MIRAVFRFPVQIIVIPNNVEDPVGIDGDIGIERLKFIVDLTVVNHERIRLRSSVGVEDCAQCVT